MHLHQVEHGLVPCRRLIRGVKIFNLRPGVGLGRRVSGWASELVCLCSGVVEGEDAGADEGGIVGPCNGLVLAALRGWWLSGGRGESGRVG